MEYLIKTSRFNLIFSYFIGLYNSTLLVTVVFGPNDTISTNPYLFSIDEIRTKKKFMNRITINNNSFFNKYIYKTQRDVLLVQKLLLNTYTFDFGL